MLSVGWDVREDIGYLSLDLRKRHRAVCKDTRSPSLYSRPPVLDELAFSFSSSFDQKVAVHISSLNTLARWVIGSHNLCCPSDGLLGGVNRYRGAQWGVAGWTIRESRLGRKWLRSHRVVTCSICLLTADSFLYFWSCSGMLSLYIPDSVYFAKARGTHVPCSTLSWRGPSCQSLHSMV